MGSRTHGLVMSLATLMAAVCLPIALGGPVSVAQPTPATFEWKVEACLTGPPPLAPVRVSTLVKNATDSVADNLNVHVEGFDSLGRRVLKHVFEHQRFASKETRILRFAHIFDGTEPVRLQLEVYQSDYAAAVARAENALTVDIAAMRPSADCTLTWRDLQPSFTVTASISPDAPRPRVPLQVIAVVRNASPVTVEDSEVHVGIQHERNHAKQRIFQKIFKGNDFKPNQSRQFAVAFTPPDEDRLIVEVGVCSEGCETVYVWWDRATTAHVRKPAE